MKNHATSAGKKPSRKKARTRTVKAGSVTVRIYENLNRGKTSYFVYGASERSRNENCSSIWPQPRPSPRTPPRRSPPVRLTTRRSRSPRRRCSARPCASDVLFNGLPEGPRLLFKGGTSLSKGFGLISRFSEDIDITVFREDIGQPASIEELEGLSGKKRRARLDAIRSACQAYISGPLVENLSRVASQALQAAGMSEERGRIELDKSDETGQSLLFWYPTVMETSLEYVRSAVKIESGAKSALDPHQAVTITPYVTTDHPDLDLRVERVTTVNPERTFRDKIMILHCQRRWFENRGDSRHGGQMGETSA